MWELWILLTTLSQHFVKCKNGLYMKCRSWWVEQYWYSWLFQSRPSRVLKTSAWLWILSKFNIWVVQTFPNEILIIRPNVELDECNKLCIHDFSSWDHPGFGRVFLKTNVLTLVKLGQMTHLMTSNETILNTKLLELIEIYIWYIVHLDKL